jgi:hypothetical protein
MRSFKLSADTDESGAPLPSRNIVATDGTHIPIGASIGLWFQFRSDWQAGAAQLFAADGVTVISFSGAGLAALIAPSQ